MKDYRKKWKKFIAVVVMIGMIGDTLPVSAMAVTEQAESSETKSVYSEKLSQERDLAIATDETTVETTMDDSTQETVETPIDKSDKETNESSTKESDKTPTETQAESNTETSKEITTDESKKTADETSTESLDQDAALKAEQESVQSETAEAVSLMDVTYFNTAEEFKAACGNYGNVTIEAGKITGLEVIDSSALILLSNTDPSLYQNVNLTKNLTGADPDLTKTATVTVTGTEPEGTSTMSFTYQGLGSAEHPFQGTLTDTWGFVLKRPLFECLSSKAKTTGESLTLTWYKNIETGESSVIFANQFVFEAAVDGEAAVSPAWNLKLGIQNYGETKTECIGGVIGTMGAPEDAQTDTLALSVDYSAVNTNGAHVDYKTGDSHVGLFCNEIKSGTLSVTGLVLPDGMVVNLSATGAGFNAGGLVGNMESDTGLILNSNVSLNNVVSISSSLGDAGGLVGSAQDISLTQLGGTQVTIGECRVLGSTSAGGVIGAYTLTTASTETETVWNTFPDTINVSDVVLSANTAIGGIFGKLGLENTAAFSINGPEEQKLAITSMANGDNSSTVYGGVFGQVSGSNTEILNAVTIMNVEAVTTEASSVGVFGGVVGAAGFTETAGVYIQLNDVKTSISNVSLGSSFGGVAGVVSEKSVLDITDVEVNTNLIEIKGGTDKYAGGLLGEIKQGAALRMTGTIDLANTTTSPAAYTGQLVGYQDSSLVYAEPGWTYIRSASSSYVDDIGNYGSVIRLGGNLTAQLITLNENHKITIAETNSKYSKDLSIGSADDFARLAIAIQTNKEFWGYTEESEGVLVLGTFDTAITLTGNIDLVGTGLTGFMRDNGDGSFNTFRGSLAGADHTIILSAGECFGTRGDAATSVATDGSEAGSGQIYRHANVGLFANVDNADISNVSVDGTLYYGAQYSNQAVGGIAATAGNIILDNVTTNISAVRVDGNTGNGSDAGGMIGRIAADSTEVRIINSTGNADLSETVVGNTDAIRQGGIIGRAEAASTISFSEVKVGGNVNAETVTSGRAGALIAQMDSGKKQTVTISGVTISEYRSTIKATSTGGGFLGYDWANADVIFTAPEKGYALTVTENSAVEITGSNPKMGGLVYQAFGYWQVNANGILMGTCTVNNGGSGDLGLIACQGTSLYLELTDNTAYKAADVTVTSTTSIFDELVAHTVDSANNIMDNGKGIISIATENNEPLSETVLPYQNQTEYGKVHTANSCSRYYYNLDKFRADYYMNETDSANSYWNNIDCVEKLVLVSVRTYAADSLKDKFWKNNTSSYKVAGIINLSGYSYYPVTITDGKIQIEEADITFNNALMEQIGRKDTVGKSTKGGDTQSQHYMMHGGLFYNCTTSAAASTSKVLTFSATSLTLSGNIGILDGTSGSGALFCGTVSGQANNVATNTMNLSLNSITLDDLTVNGNAGYQPLLINKIGNYTSFSLTTLRCYQKIGELQSVYETKASSLIGNVGSTKAIAITLLFSDIKLDGSRDAQQFTAATLLNSFQYPSNSGCVGYYNFNQGEDWNTEGTHLYNVTYGWEISESVENEGSQKKYYDTDVFVSPESNNATIEYSFKNNYLPYVRQAYTSTNMYHELKVNIKADHVDLLNGCGTYTHPYVIEYAEQLVRISEYLENGATSPGWQLRYNEDGQDSVKSEDNCQLYVATSSGWEKTENPSTDTSKTPVEIRTYLRNAYYQIQNDIELGAGFNGFGSDSYPFRGVIVGKELSPGTYPTITILSTVTTDGFIPYSYGSVVKDLNIAYTGIENKPHEISSTLGTDKQFGGVIGRVYGGDNIIDNVNVTYNSNYKISLSDTKDYLIPVGGYVGLLEAGGVIFRNMSRSGEMPYTNVMIDNNAAITDDNYFYINHYVGRVLNGFAFYETTENTGLNNTDKNYQIAKINVNDTKIKIPSEVSKKTNNTYTRYEVELEGAQQLLIFSAMVNSGATAGNSVYAYYSDTEHGKLRNAEYDHIGEKYSDSYSSEYSKVQKCESIPTTSQAYPYLITQYTESEQSKRVTQITATYKRVSLKLLQNTYDMSVYGNGYRAIGGRYKCKSSQDGINSYNVDRAMTYIREVEGNNSSIIVNENVKEYSDDGYHATAVGGIFNAFQTEDRVSGSDISNYYATVKNLTITGSNQKNTPDISMTYYDVNQAIEDKQKFSDKGDIGVGGFAGKTANRSSANQRYVKFENVNLENLTVSGTTIAGGLIGAVGYKKDIANMSSTDNEMNLTLDKCSYENIYITAERYAGGFIGAISSNAADSAYYSTNRIFGQLAFSNSGNSDSTEKPSTIKTTYTIAAAGALVGLSDTALSIDNAFADTEEAAIHNVNITSVDAGALVGYTYWKKSTNKNDVTVTDYKVDGVNINGADNAGLIAGQEVNAPTNVTNLIFSNNILSATGTIGAITGKTTGTITGSNILWKDNKFTASATSTTIGTWCGNTSQSIWLAGVSRQISSENPLEAAIPDKDVGNKTYNGATDSYTGYISYADYTGNASSAANAAELAVTTSPDTGITIDDSSLYGDGAASSEDKPIVQIISEGIVASSSSTNPKYYENTNAEAFAEKLASDVTRSTYLSTYQSNQQGGQYADSSVDFPVLLVSASSEESLNNITDYLNLVTNGGYAKAVAGGKDQVEVTSAQYGFDGTKFEKQTVVRGALKATQTNDAVTFSVTSEYDNDRDRFTLLSATFKAGDETHTVYVPIIVKRVLQMDFMATMTYGRVFAQSEYRNLTQHILESYGNTVSALLTYQYNSTNNTNIKYGWQSYLDGGGNLNTSYDKLINLSNISGSTKYPAGTQFTLIDCQNGDQVYTYKLANEASDTNLSLSMKVDFGASGMTLGELMGAAASVDSSGRYVRWEDGDTNPATVKASDGYYYRLAVDEDTGQKYRVTVEDEKVSESYYLLIKLPLGENLTGSINGTIQTTLSGEGVPPYNLTKIHRADYTADDSSNTESTYSFLSSYNTTLNDNNETESIEWENESDQLKIKLDNTISFDSNQNYNSYDELYLNYQVGLKNNTGENLQIPSGVNGIAVYYVYLQMQTAEGRQYYQYTESGWKEAGSEPVAAFPDNAITWSSDGTKMKLNFGISNREEDMVSLRELRANAKDQGLGDFHVELNMDLTFSQSAAESAIPVADRANPSDYVQFSYRAAISPDKNTLAYTNSSHTITGDVKYYRVEDRLPSLVYEANDTSELGINCAEATTGAVSSIYTTASYDLSKVDGMSTIWQKNAQATVRLQLELQKKNENGTYDQVKNPADYITVFYNDQLLNWTDSQIVLDTGAKSVNTFTFPILLQVDTTVKDYANYQMRVCAYVQEDDTILINEAQDYITYTLARIVTDGIWTQ